MQAFSQDRNFLRIDQDTNGYAMGVFLKLNPFFIPKVNTDANRESEIYLEAFCRRTDPQSHNTLYMCCVARAVDKYVQATRAFRRTDQLLVCFSGPRKGLAVSKMTIARWVRRLMYH